MSGFQDGERDQLEQIVLSLINSSKVSVLLLSSSDSCLFDLRCRQPAIENPHIFAEKVIKGWASLRFHPSFYPAEAIYEGKTNSLLIANIGPLILGLVFDRSLEEDVVNAYHTASSQIKKVISNQNFNSIFPLHSSKPLNKEDERVISKQIPSGWPPNEEETLGSDDIEHLNKFLKESLVTVKMLCLLGKDGNVIYQKLDNSVTEDMQELISFVHQSQNLAREWGESFVQKELFPCHVYQNHTRSLLLHTTSETTSLMVLCDSKDIDNTRLEINKVAQGVNRILHNAWNRMVSDKPENITEDSEVEKNIDWKALLSEENTSEEDDNYCEDEELLEWLGVPDKIPDLGPGPEEVNELLLRLVKRSGAQGAILIDQLGQIVGKEGKFFENREKTLAFLLSESLSIERSLPTPSFHVYKSKENSVLILNVEGSLLAVAFENKQEGRVREILKDMLDELTEMAREFGGVKPRGEKEDCPPKVHGCSEGINQELNFLLSSIDAQGVFLFTRDGKKVAGYGEFDDKVDMLVTFSAGAWEDILPQTVAFGSQIFIGKRNSILITKIAQDHLLVVLFDTTHEVHVRERVVEVEKRLSEILNKADSEDEKFTEKFLDSIDSDEIDKIPNFKISQNDKKTGDNSSYSRCEEDFLKIDELLRFFLNDSNIVSVTLWSRKDGILGHVGASLSRELEKSLPLWSGESIAGNAILGSDCFTRFWHHCDEGFVVISIKESLLVIRFHGHEESKILSNVEYIKDHLVHLIKKRCRDTGHSIDAKSITKKLHAFKESNEVDGVFLLDESGQTLVGFPESDRVTPSLAMAAGGWTAAGKPHGFLLQRSNGKSLLMTGIGEYLLTTVCEDPNEPQVRDALDRLATGLAPFLDNDSGDTVMWQAFVDFPQRIPKGKWQTLRVSISRNEQKSIPCNCSTGTERCSFVLSSNNPLEISLVSRVFETRQDSCRELILPPSGPILYHVRGLSPGPAELALEFFQTDKYLGTINLKALLF